MHNQTDKVYCLYGLQGHAHCFDTEEEAHEWAASEGWAYYNIELDDFNKTCDCKNTYLERRAL
jgi:hypothetical protein